MSWMDGGGFVIFQSTLSVRRATGDRRQGQTRQIISIHALREESDLWRIDVFTRRIISIHALREESDSVKTDASEHLQISIHALREESDLSNHLTCASREAFQSTLSVRRATGRIRTT